MAVRSHAITTVRPVPPQRTGGIAFFIMLAVLPPLGLILLLYPPLIAIGIALPALLLVPWMWQKPLRGLYLLLGGTLLIEVFPLHFADSLTDRVPLFLNLNNANSSAGLSGVPITPAEILMLAVILIWIFQAISTRSLALPRGPLVTAYLLFGLVVVGAELHGMISRGNYLNSLWELRPQAYGFVAFILTASLVKDRDDVRRLVYIFFAAVGFKAALSLFRYFVTLQRHTSGIESIMAHEESYFFAVFLIAVLAAVLWYAHRRQLWPLLVLSPVVGLALMVNHRRAGDLAATVALAVLVILAIRFRSVVSRERLVLLSFVAVLASTVFILIFWNHTYGTIGELVRPYRSFIEPDPRDASSNLYRIAEDANILVTFRSSPLVGIGFGLPMRIVYPMADISKIYPLWNYIPHNTLLWIGMRMGVVGYITFFGLIGMGVLTATRQLAIRKDPFLCAVAAGATAAIAAELVQGYYDLQLDAFRNLIFLGVLLGVLNRMPELADE